MKSARIVITGATSGLGRNLTESLLAKGAVVTALGRNRKIGEDLEKRGARFLQGDLADVPYLLNAFSGQDFLVHSAALASPWGPYEAFEAANVTGTKNVLRAAQQLNISRLVHISTPSIYFSGRPSLQILETAPLPSPYTHYARSKLAAEVLVKQSGIPAIILRPRALFGRYDQSILPRILRIMKTGFFPLPDGGRALVDVTHVSNVVHAIELGLFASLRSSGASADPTFNITNDEPMTVRDLTKLVANVLDLKVRFIEAPLLPLLAVARLNEWAADFITHREPSLTRYSIGLLGVSQTLDISRAKNELGYAPLITVREGLEAYAREQNETR